MSSMQSVQFGVGHRVKMPCALGDKPCALTPSTRASTVQPRCGTCSSASSRIALRNTSEMRQHAAIMRRNTTFSIGPHVRTLGFAPTHLRSALSPESPFSPSFCSLSLLLLRARRALGHAMLGS